MRRIIDNPVDVLMTSDLRVFSLCRIEGMAKISRVSWEDDSNLGDIGSYGNKKGQMIWPVQMILDSDENLIISDEALNRITVLSTQGDYINSWGQHGHLEGELDKPSGIALDPDKNLYVVDTMNHRIQKFTTEGEFLINWGRFGTHSGEFNMPWGIAVDEIGDVYVSDWRNDRVQKFSSNGKFIFSIGSSGTGKGEFRRPSGLAVDKHGDIYVADSENDRIQLFNQDGQYIEQFTGDASLSISGRAYLLANAKPLRLREMADIEPQRRLRGGPKSVRVDNQFRMFIPDYGSYRIQVYQKDAIPLSQSDIIKTPRSPTLSVT